MNIFKTLLQGSAALLTTIGVATIVSRMFRPMDPQEHKTPTGYAIERTDSFVIGGDIH